MRRQLLYIPSPSYFFLRCKNALTADPDKYKPGVLAVLLHGGRFRYSLVAATSIRCKFQVVPYFWTGIHIHPIR